MSASTSGLSARGIDQRFGDRIVLDGVDLEVPPGRVIGLLGPNGAGKTTLMRILFGVLEPDAGSVDWNGKPATAADRRGWGYMPQERGLYRDMKVREQVIWIARLHGLAKVDAATRTDLLLDKLGIGDRANDKVEDLSGGMAQRVQLAATMVHEPDVLVLDEPFAGLDPVAVEFLSTVIVEHVDQGRILVLSSHQLDLVEDLCETITMIHRGRVVLRGDVAELKSQSAARFLRVDVDVDQAWLQAGDVQIEQAGPRGSRLRLAPGTDAFSVLDAIRTRTTVTDFGVETPSLSELFLDAAGESAESVESQVEATAEPRMQADR